MTATDLYSGSDRPELASSFDRVAAEYDSARPSYPDALFDAIEQLAGRPLAGADVLDVGAGTGISTRLLRARGARVTAVEPTPGMAAQLHAVSPEIPLVRGNGNALPFRDSSVDLITYAQAFHWTDWDRSVPETARVLRPGGALAVWWNVKDRRHEWVHAQEVRLRAACPDYHAYGRVNAGAAELRRRGLRAGTAVLEWERRISVETALRDLTSRSYFAVLTPKEREPILAAERDTLLEAFPDGTVIEPFVLDLSVGIPLDDR